MDKSDTDDPVLDFYSDPSERETDKSTFDDTIQDTGETVQEYEYDDDFENVTTDCNEKGVTDESYVGNTSADSNTRSLSDRTYGTSGSPDASPGRLQQRCDDTSSDDKWNSGNWRGPLENGSSRGKTNSVSRQGKVAVKKTPALKQVGRTNRTTKSDFTSSYESSDFERGDRFTSYRRSTNTPPDSDFPNFEESRDDIDISLTSDTSSDVLLKNDRFNNFCPTSQLSSSDSQSMTHRKKMSLPQVDKSKRIQLTRRTRDSRQTQARKEQTKTHAARVSRETGTRVPSFKGKPALKPPIPIPLKSEALYCNGELTVNVRGDKRGNPGKNKFNVTITVVQKHMRTKHGKTNPYTARQRTACKKRWRQDDLDWDIVQHRAVLPGFNTATDPEVNRRYLHQFGI